MTVGLALSGLAIAWTALPSTPLAAVPNGPATDGSLSAPATAAIHRVLSHPARIPVQPERIGMIAVARAGKRMVAVGLHGLILLSDDDGAQWRVARTTVDVTLTAVRFASARVGWATGHLGVVLHTRDGGETWITQLSGITANDLELAAAKEEAARHPGDAMAAGWLRMVERQRADGPGWPFLNLLVEDEQRATVIGANGIAFATQDGGARWSSISARLGHRQGHHLYGIQSDGDGALVAGELGLLLRATTRNGPFEELTSPYEGSFFGALRSGARLVLYGLRGRVFVSGDGGSTWRPIAWTGQAAFTGGVALPDGRVLLADQSGGLAVSDAGLTKLTPLALRLPPIAGLDVTEHGTVIAVGVAGPKRIPADVLIGKE
ncbi:WD40/YVTN/BNR-like repeat-containing protein [Azospirillum griseum]|uniref:Photosynthesis system II assembly factor Ycf48/Hcf136-like domain-containing protein n=1 Tax=Azospirillum griseum TaxID=2496639 RepID=A0A431VB40_9PROT|nr:hypothetical protein [Azospirillum griseum]RTR14615.1 hypothetical protein EJ903_23745 [Azospirillum griseum]